MIIMNIFRICNLDIRKDCNCDKPFQRNVVKKKKLNDIKSTLFTNIITQV